MAQYLPLPDGTYLKLQEGESPDAGLRRAQAKYPEAFAPAKPAAQPESGFFPALKAGAVELGGGISALMGRAGLKDEAKAQAEYEAAKKRAAEIFKPTEEGWTEAPFTKFKELLGGSLPYMAAPLAAGVGAAALPLTGTAAAVAGLGAAGLTSAGQFTATNLSRQLEEGKKLAETDLGAAALAAVPQAALDTLSMRMIPGIGRMFGQAGIKVTAETAKDIAEQGLKKTLIDYTAKTGKTAGIEGATEAAQQVFERLQAGLSITDAKAREEYFDSFLGGAVLGGTLAVPGRYVERGREQREARGLLEGQAAAERKAAREAEEAQKKDPAYALKLDADYQAAVAKMKELQAAVPKRPAKDALPEEQMAYKTAVEARNTHLKEVLQPLAAEYVPRKTEIAQLKERQRVEGLSPQQYMLEQMGIPGTIPEEELPPELAALVPVKEAPPKLPADVAYAQQQLDLANRQQDLDLYDPKDRVAIQTEYLMQNPSAARMLVKNQTALPGVGKRENTAILSALKAQLVKYDEQIARDLEAERPDLAPQRKDVDTFAPWKQAIEAEERLREEEAMAVEPVRKEEAVISPAREEQIKALETARKRYFAAAETYQNAKGTPDGARALQQLLAARKEYDAFAKGPLVGQMPRPVLSPETEAQLDQALKSTLGEAPASEQELETRIQRMADTRKTAIAKVSENASELAQYERLTQYMGTPQGLSEVARTPEMAEAAKRRMTPMLEQAQASRNEAVAAAIQEIRLQRDLSGLAPLDKTDAELQVEFREKLNKDLQQAKGKAKVDDKKRQAAIAQQIQRINSRIQQIEGGDRGGRLLGYASAFRTQPERVGELNNLYKAYRNLSMQQGLTPQAAQLNRTLQNLVDFYTVGGGAAKQRVVAKGPREARRELVLGERAFTGYEPTIEGTEVRYQKPRKMAEYAATSEEQALVEDMRARELAELNEAADRQYTPETSDRVKKQIFDALRSRIDNFNAPATQEEVDAARAQAAPRDETTGDLFAAATERAQAELQAAGERRTAARSELGRAMAGMRGKSAVMDQAQRLAEKFGKDLGLEGTFAAAKQRLTQAQAAKRAAETEFAEKEQEALRAAADDALIAQRDAEAATRAASNTVDAIAARLKAEKETPAVEVRTPPRARVLLQKIIDLQALIADGGARQALATQVQALTAFSPTRFMLKPGKSEGAETEVGMVKALLDQATRAAKEGTAWANDIEQVQAHMATLEKYLSRREAQGRLLPAAELMAKEWYRKLAAHETALRRPMYGAGQLTPAEIRDYTQRRLEMAQAEYDRIKLQIDGLHRQLLDTEVAVAKREVTRITGEINALVSRMERREGADLANQELKALTEQHKDAVANLNEAQKTFDERKKAESVPFTRKSPASALAQWTKDAEARFEQSVQRFKDKQKALELQFATPETRTGEAPVTTAAQRRAEIEQEKAATAREATGAFMPVPQTLQDQLEGALKAQSKLKKRGSKKQRAAIAQRIQEIRSQLSGLGRYGQEYYDTTVAEFEAQDEAEAREAGKEETTRAGRRKAAKEIFGVQRTIAETGEVPQATRDANLLDPVLRSNRQAFEMAVEQGFKSTAIRPQKRGKSATPERLMRTPLEGIAYRLRQEIIEKLEAPQTKKQKQELNKLREHLYGLEEAINTAPVTVEERRRTARAIWAKLPKDMRNSLVDTFKGRTESGGITTSFFDRFADALETTVIRQRLGQPLSQAPLVKVTDEALAPIQAETEKRVAATMKATEELRQKYYEQKEKELTEQARLKGEVSAIEQQRIEKEANEFADRVMQRLEEEKAREATRRMTEPMRGKAAEDIEFSRGKPVEGLTKEELTAELERALGQKGLLGAQNVLTVVNSVADLKSLKKLPPALKDNLDAIPDDAKGFVYDGKAYLIAENIGKDHALGVLLHEVGAHIGFRNFFNTAQYNALVETVKRWSKSKANTPEAKIGRAAMERVKAAETSADQIDDELLAYAVEEAFNAGVEPTGVKGGNAVQNWLRMIVDGFKRALEKFGLAPQNLKVGDLVNMAYGAANLELRGTWHGTGKPFKEFDFKYMGRGEGVQVYGWGTYRAQSYGTAKHYKDMLSNINAEAIYENLQYKGKNFEAMMADFKKLSPDERVVASLLENAIVSPFFAKNKTELENNTKAFFESEIERVERRIKNPISPSLKKASEKELEGLQKIDLSAFDILDYEAVGKGGAMARVLSTTPDDAYFILDLPLSKQSDYVKAAVADFVASGKTEKGRVKVQRIMENRGLTPHAMVDQLETMAKDVGLTPKDVSLKLRQYGIAGYKYLDRGSRTGKIDKDSKFNYVDFYDKDEGPAIVAWDIDRVGPAEGILFSRNLPTAARVAEQIVGQQKGWLQKLRENFLGIGGRAQFVDMRFPLEEALKRGGVEDLDAMQAMYYVRMYDQKMHFTSEAITEGVPQVVELTRKDGRTERVIEAKTGANLTQAYKILTSKEVIKEAGSADAANKLVTLYMAAIRGANKGYDKLNFGRAWATQEIQRLDGELKRTGLEPAERANLQKRKASLVERLDTLPTVEDIKASRAEIEANPVLREAFDKVREVYNEYNRNLLELAVQTGAISRDHARTLLAQNDYISYYRMRGGVAEMVIGDETPIRIGNIKDNQELQELVGGDEPILDFLTSSMQNTSMLVDMSLRNIAMKNAMFELRDVGLATIAKEPKGGAPKGSVTFKKDGEDYYAMVNTDALGISSDLLVKGLAGIPTMFPMWVRAMGVPARILRRAIVAAPPYWAKQVFRDSLGAAMSSGADIVPILGALRQIGKDNVLERRGITGGQVFTGLPEDKKRMMDAMQSGKVSLTRGMAWLEATSAKADALTRKNQYENYLKQGLSEMEATYMALESMNFSKRGLSPSVHYANILIPFFNSQIQGLDALYKAFTGKMPMNERLEIRQKLWTRGMFMFAISMAYAWAMQDDEAYKNAKPEEKYSNWFVPLKNFGIDATLRLPIPFELGYIFKALPEAIVNSVMREEGAKEAREAFTHIAQQTVPGGSSLGMPAAIKTGLEATLGVSSYTGRPIESAQEQMLEPGYRTRENTTELARQIGEMTNFSPIKLEFLVRGYTGSMGMAALAALSAPLGSSGPEPATKRLTDLPVFGTMFQPKDASGIIDATYEKMTKVNQLKETYEDLLNKGRTADAQQYYEKHKDDMAFASLAGSFKQFMGEITQVERAVRAAPNLTPDQKRQKLDELRQAKIRTAQSVRGMVEKSKPQAAPV